MKSKSEKDKTTQALYRSAPGFFNPGKILCTTALLGWQTVNAASHRPVVSHYFTNSMNTTSLLVEASKSYINIDTVLIRKCAAVLINNLNSTNWFMINNWGQVYFEDPWAILSGPLNQMDTSFLNCVGQQLGEIYQHEAAKAQAALIAVNVGIGVFLFIGLCLFCLIVFTAAGTKFCMDKYVDYRDKKLQNKAKSEIHLEKIKTEENTDLEKAPNLQPL